MKGKNVIIVNFLKHIEKPTPPATEFRMVDPGTLPNGWIYLRCVSDFLEHFDREHPAFELVDEIFQKREGFLVVVSARGYVIGYKHATYEPVPR